MGAIDIQVGDRVILPGGRACGRVRALNQGALAVVRPDPDPERPDQPDQTLPVTDLTLVPRALVDAFRAIFGTAAA